jgi:hypothetical protein
MITKRRQTEKMIINRQIVAKKLLSYMQHKINLSQLVDWAENAVMEGRYQENEYKLLSEVLGKLGLADVKAFGLLWDDCIELMHTLGYKVKVDATLKV